MVNTTTTTGYQPDKDQTGTVTDRVVEVANTARGEVLRRADEATQATTDALESRPFGAVAGAIAIGAVVAALIPATERELKALGPMGVRLRDMAQGAFHEARKAGMAELSAAGLGLAAASDGTDGLISKLMKAVTAAATAATTSARGAPAPSDQMAAASDHAAAMSGSASIGTAGTIV